MHTDIVNTEHSEQGLDWTTVTSDKIAGMAAIVKKSPVFWLWKSGNPNLYTVMLQCSSF